MISQVIFWLLATINFVSAGALLPARHALAQAPASQPCAPPSTVTVMVTTTMVPDTVTIAVPDWSSISSYLSYNSMIDSEVVVDVSEEAPVSDQPVTAPQLFTHTVNVPAFPASLTNEGSGPVYVSDGSATSLPFETTTVSILPVMTISVLPLPASSSASPNGVDTVWTTVFVTAAANAASNASQLISATYNTSTTTVYATVANTTVSSTVNTIITVAPTAPTGSAGSYDMPNYYPSVVNGSYIWAEKLVKRQTCTLISAYIGQQWVSWCNNWDGSATLTYTSWETTVTPSSVPGESLPPTQAPSPTSSEASTDGSGSSSVPTSCGQSGNFEIGFDDLPDFSTDNPNPSSGAPIFNPYEHMFWGNGWTYEPPPQEIFKPQNGTHLAKYDPSLANSTSGSPDPIGGGKALYPASSFGAGPRMTESAYWFNVTSMWVGCDDGSTNPSYTCDFVATAFDWNPQTQQEELKYTQHFGPLAPCPGYVNCNLTEIFLSSEFSGISTISLYANIQGKIGVFWVDSIMGAWWNNTCAAGLERESAE